MLVEKGRVSEAQPDAAATPTTGAYGYYVVALLALIYMFSSIDRTLLSVLAEPIKLEFGLSDSQLGVLTGLVFAIAYAVAGIPLGLMVDRVGRTRMLAALVAIWSTLTLLTGFAQSVLQMMLARIGVAASESGASPASMGIITDYFPKERRGLALSLFYMSTPVAIGVSFAGGSLLATHFGWRAAFMMAAAPGLLLALLVVLTIREPQRGRFDPAPVAAPEGGKPATLIEAVTALFARPALLWLILGAICVVVAQAGMSAFMSPFLIRVHGMSLEGAGYAIALAKGPTGVVGILAGGLLADRLARRSSHAAPRAVGTLMIVAAALGVAAMMMEDWRLAIVLVGAYNFFNYTYYGATFATYMTVAPVRMRGALAGLFAVLMSLVGYGFGPPLTGIASDVFASWGFAQPLREAQMVSALFFAIGGFGFYAAARAIRRMDAAGTPL